MSALFLMSGIDYLVESVPDFHQSLKVKFYRKCNLYHVELLSGKARKSVIQQNLF